MLLRSPALITSRSSTVVCAPVYSERHGLATEVPVDVEERLTHESGILCDALVSVPKEALTDRIGSLSARKLRGVDQALRVALHLE